MGRSLPYDVGISTDLLKGRQHQHEVIRNEISGVLIFLCGLCAKFLRGLRGFMADDQRRIAANHYSWFWVFLFFRL